MPIECAVCSEDFGKFTSVYDSSSEVVVTPCGHVFHQTCLSIWLQKSYETSEQKSSCPECRHPVVMSQTRRIFFNLTPIANNLEIVNEQLNTINLKLQNKIQILLAENQQLNNNLKFRGPHKDMEKLKDKVDKLKLKVKEMKIKLATCSKMNVSTSQLNMNENVGIQIHHHNQSEATSYSMRVQPNCDIAAPAIFNQAPTPNNIQTTTGPSVASLSNQFDYDFHMSNSSSMHSMNLSSMRSMPRLPLSSYQAPNSYIPSNSIGSDCLWPPMMSPMSMPSMNSLASQMASSSTNQPINQQQNIHYNQMNVIMPIPMTSAINASYVSTNEPDRHYVSQWVGH